MTNWPFTDETKEEFLARIQLKYRRDIKALADAGCFELDDDFNPVAFPIKIKRSELPEDATMAHVVHKIGMFPSVTQARKNGWNTEIKLGEHVFTKKKIRVLIEE